MSISAALACRIFWSRQLQRFNAEQLLTGPHGVTLPENCSGRVLMVFGLVGSCFYLPLVLDLCANVFKMDQTDFCLV